MNNFEKYIYAFAITLFFFTSGNAQIQLGLVANQFAERIEVYALHKNPEFKSSKTYLEKGKITLVSTAGNQFKDLRNINGFWAMDTTIIAPTENPENDYYTFIAPEYIEVNISGSAPTLLFTAEFDSINMVQLIAEEDPYIQIAETIDYNPRNTMNVVNVEQGDVISYADNYVPCEFRPYPCELNDYLAKKDEEKETPETEKKDIMVLENEKDGQSRQ